MSERKLFALIQKVEYMTVALGGNPDVEVNQNKNYIDQYEEDTKNIREALKKAKQKLQGRQQFIRKVGFRSKERVCKPN